MRTRMLIACSTLAIIASMSFANLTLTEQALAQNCEVEAGENAGFVFRYKTGTIYCGDGEAEEPDDGDVPGDTDDGDGPGDPDNGDENGPGEGDDDGGENDDDEDSDEGNEPPELAEGEIRFDSSPYMDIGANYSAPLSRHPDSVGPYVSTGDTSDDCGLAVNPTTGAVSGVIDADNGDLCTIEVLDTTTGATATLSKRAWFPLNAEYMRGGSEVEVGKVFEEEVPGYLREFYFSGGNESLTITVTSSLSLGYDIISQGDNGYINTAYGVLVGDSPLNTPGVYDVTVTATDSEGRIASHPYKVRVKEFEREFNVAFALVDEEPGVDPSPPTEPRIDFTTADQTVTEEDRIAYQCFHIPYENWGVYALIDYELYDGAYTPPNINVDVVKPDQLDREMFFENRGPLDPSHSHYTLLPYEERQPYDFASLHFPGYFREQMGVAHPGTDRICVRMEFPNNATKDWIEGHVLTLQFYMPPMPSPYMELLEGEWVYVYGYYGEEDVTVTKKYRLVAVD